ncbi:MAG: carbon-nitrogen hydrolase family protein [Verrucomicrobia bacterium]|nr:carbon-nitrogen hydrolase family protein [Verrucomicrobiota bacterium]
MNLPRRAKLLTTLGALFLATIPAGATADPPAAGQRVRVAAISFVPRKLDLPGNADRLEQAFRQATAGGAKIAVAPEGALDGYVVNQMLAGEIPVARMHDVALPVDHAVIQRFQTLAKALELCLVFGFAEKVSADVFNTAVFIDGAGAIRGKYRKMQFAEGYHPGWWFNRLGAQSRAFDTPFGRCGILICNDRWNPALARIPALDGAQFLVIPSFGSKSESQDEAVLSRARENGLPVIEANVGVSLIVSEGNVAVVQREPESIAFADIVIPAPLASKPAERDEEERKFLAWRAGEMQRRYESKYHRFGRTGGQPGEAK